MTRSIPLHVAAAALLATAGVGVSIASAAAIPAFSGNTQPQGATVNFAVYDHSGSTTGDSFGTGLAGFDALFGAGAASGAFDISASYLYLYQTVANDLSGGAILTKNAVDVTSSNVTSWGRFTGTSFSTAVLGAPAVPGNTSPASTGATPTILGAQSGLFNPNSLTDSASSVNAYFLTPYLTNGNKSILWGYTSNAVPIIGNTTISTGAAGHAAVAGALAVPTPTASVAGLALLTIPALSRLRRRQAQSD